MFAIYFPGKTGSNVQHFHDAGLSDLLGADADAPPSFVDFQQGPDGGHGMAASWAGRPIMCGEFEWTEVKGKRQKAEGKNFWLGKLGGEKPKPEWFERRKIHLGKDVVMADGQQWHLPMARELPCVLGLDDEGLLKSTIVPHYSRFWDQAWKTTEWWQQNPDGSISMRVMWRDGYDFACLALSINYRVNDDVCSWLGLVSTDLLFDIADAVTEITAAYEAQKKTADGAGPLTSAGDGA